MAFHRDNKSGGRRDFGRRNFDSGRGSDDRQMFRTTCSNCGKDCEVPFKPTGSKPVYCRDCFRTMGTGSDSRRTDDRDSRRPAFENRGDRNRVGSFHAEQFEALNTKLDEILKLLSSEKPMEVQEETPVESTSHSKKKTGAKKTILASDSPENPATTEISTE